MTLPQKPAVAVQDDQILLAPRDVAARWGVPISWVYAQAEAGKLPGYKLGKYLRFDRTDLRAYIDAKRAASRRQPRRR